MKNRFYLPSVLLISVITFLAAVSLQAKPNIVLLLADDCTRFDLGCYGSKNSITPSIDRLALQGMRFTRCCQSSSTCSPTRHNLYTGMYPTRTGAYPNHTIVNDSVKSIVQRLRPLGYRVALAGKRHILPESIFAFEYLDNGGDASPNFTSIDTFISSAVSGNQPFCLFICSHLPHGPWDQGDRSKFNANTLDLPPHFYDNVSTRNNYRNYLAEINVLDSQVQKSLNLLTKYNISDSTVFFFASEQGSSMPFGKWTCYNAGIGSAMIVRWPGIAAANSVSNALIEYSDIVPTFIDIAGGNPVKGLDGSSLAPLLKGQVMKHKGFSYGQATTRGIVNGADYYPIRSVCDGVYRLIINYAPGVSFECGVDLSGWNEAARTDPIAAKLVNRHHYRPSVELYNDSTDPWNMNNLADSARYDSVQAALQNKLAQWLAYTRDNVFKTELSAFDRMPSKTAFNGDSVIVIEEASPSSAITNAAGGLTFELYNGTWTSLPDFTSLTPARTGTVANFNNTSTLTGRTGNRYAVRYRGFVSITVKGYYTFYVNSCNHTRLFIDNQFVAGTVEKKAAANPARRYGCILVDSGLHAINVEYLGNSVNDSLSISWSYPGAALTEGKMLIPDSHLTHGDPVQTLSHSPRGSLPGIRWRVAGNTLLFSEDEKVGGVRLFNAQGAIAGRMRNPVRMNLSNLPAGVYVVEAQSNGGYSVTGKIIRK